MTTIPEVIRFWLDEVGEAGWYQGSDALDQTIRDRFGASWEAARDGQLGDWHDTAEGSLAFLIISDQFSRNLWREDARAFALDPAAKSCAEQAIERGFDMDTPLPQRQFFYTPFMHSEDPADQDRAVALYKERLCDTPGTGENLHARVHREIIHRFGRFPYRNAALGRDTSAEEMDFIDNGGYRKLVEMFEAQEK